MTTGGAPEAAIAAAEDRLGHRFPVDYRNFLTTRNGVEGEFGEVYLALFAIEDVVDRNIAHRHLEYQPELIHIGSDGGGEAIAFDYRSEPPTIVLVNMVSIDWSEAIFQAASFAEFMEQRERGEAFQWRSNG